MASRMRGGRAVLLFPEGTTHDGLTLGRFHASHYAAARDLLRADRDRDAVMVQPVAIAYSSALAPWIGDDTLLAHLWRVLRGAPMRCHVAFAAPIAYAREDDRKVVARISRNSIEGLLESLRPAVVRADGDIRASEHGPGHAHAAPPIPAGQNARS
jgi:1-acyl-sn-glycerol-3-phosphate acyltransferase